ncbi:M48 family metallopeptidase [Planctomycetota bacterium]
MSTVIIDIPNTSPVVLAKSKRAKRLSITVKRNQTVRLTIPRGVSMRTAKQFLLSRIPWIEKHLRKFKELESEQESPPLPKINEVKAKCALIMRLREIADIHNYNYAKVTIRKQKTRWGSCSAKNNISLNMNLVRLPEQLRDYVILHELVHTRIKNHSKKFWLELDKAIGGDAKVLAKKVRNYKLRQMV